MALLKNVFVRSNDKTNYHPNTEPTTTNYTTQKAKNYSTTLRHLKTTATGYKNMYGQHQMWMWHKALKRSQKLGATAMAA